MVIVKSRHLGLFHSDALRHPPPPADMYFGIADSLSTPPVSITKSTAPGWLLTTKGWSTERQVRARVHEHGNTCRPRVRHEANLYAVSAGRGLDGLDSPTRSVCGVTTARDADFGYLDRTSSV